MDISKYIDQFLDEEEAITVPLVEDIENDRMHTIYENNEDDEDDNALDEYEKQYLEQIYNPENLDSFDRGEYMIEMINIFMIYYNNKYNKKDNIFTGIQLAEYTETTDTNSQMELFFEYSIEFKQYAQNNNIDENELLNKYYLKSEYKHINDQDKIYILEYNNKKIVAPCLFILLNYIYIQKMEYKIDYTSNEINIYNLDENI